MIDPFRRSIDYLRISVTDRCNLRCHYCMPAEGKAWMDREDLLSYEEIALLVERVFVPLGLTKIRLTGGEPLLRRDLHQLVAKLRALPEIRDISLTTNALFLADQAPALKAAGLNRVNISLDSLDPERFRQITRGGDVSKVLRGLHKALEVGLEPIKLNTVVLPGVNDEADLLELAELTLQWPVHVRFIEFMPVGDRALFQASHVVTAELMRERIRERHPLEPVQDGPLGNGPANYWRLPGALGTVGFINPMSRHFCDTCNRFRLTADGRVKACLLKQSELSLRDLLRSAGSDEALRQRVFEALALKPEWHENGVEVQELTMSQIGG
ncbi:MAG TPA: GTP 3',8-cyclase MoaA [Stenomitos sp.]